MIALIYFYILFHINIRVHMYIYYLEMHVIRVGYML